MLSFIVITPLSGEVTSVNVISSPSASTTLIVPSVVDDEVTNTFVVCNTGVSLTFSTVKFSVTFELREPSLAEIEALSLPKKSALGVYVNSPFASIAIVPLLGAFANV